MLFRSVMGPFGRAAERGQIVREGKKLETARLGEEQRVAQEAAQKAGLETAQMPPTPQGGVETLAGSLDRAYAAQSQLKSISDQMATLEAKFSDPAQYTMAEYPVLREQYKQLEQQYNEIAEKQPYLPSTYEALQRKIAYKTKQFETAVKAQKFEDADKLQQEVADLRQQVEQYENLPAQVGRAYTYKDLARVQGEAQQEHAAREDFAQKEQANKEKFAGQLPLLETLTAPQQTKDRKSTRLNSSHT